MTELLSPGTQMGAVSLTVSDLAGLREFYTGVLGLHVAETRTDEVTLGAADGTPLLILHQDRDAPAGDPHGPGLFHVAILLATRRDLADALRRVAAARWPLTGASDHLVSEALYLRDPEGNGIEIYRDRPRDRWPRDDDGGIEMATLRLDLDDLLLEDAAADGPMAAGTRVGHVHLQVSDIPRAEAFYCGLLGLQPTTRAYHGALFASAGGYHHHVGLNTWNSSGAPAAVSGARGLRDVEVLVADRGDLERVRARLATAGLDAPPSDDGAAHVRDPFGNPVTLRAA